MEDYVSVPEKPGVPSDNDDVAIGAAVEVLLPANPKRKSALIVNTGENEMRVTTDGSAPTATHGKPIGKGGTLTLSSPYCSVGEVKAFSTDGTTANASEVN